MVKRVKIYTVAGKPDFIALQAKSLNAFCRDPFELIVIDNAASQDLSDSITSVSRACGLRCVQSGEQDHSSPSMANAVPLNWLWRKYVAADTDNISVVIDFDMFLVGAFSFVAELGSHALAAVKQARQHIKYLWCGLVIADASQLPAAADMDWLCGPIDGVNTDVGGHMYWWLRSYHKQIRLKNIEFTGDIRAARGNLDVLPGEIRARYKDEFDWQIYARKVLHYKRGSGWSSQDSRAYHEEKSRLLFEFVQRAINGRIELPDHVVEWRGWNSGALNDYNKRAFINYWDNFDDPVPAAS